MTIPLTLNLPSTDSVLGVGSPDKVSGGALTTVPVVDITVGQVYLHGGN